MAKNIDVIQAFVNGEIGVKTKNLKIDGNRLISYQTIIAERNLNEDRDYEFLINETNYSASTSKIQNMLFREVQDWQIADIFDDIPMGTSYF